MYLESLILKPFPLGSYVNTSNLLGLGLWSPCIISFVDDLLIKIYITQSIQDFWIKHITSIYKNWTNINQHILVKIYFQCKHFKCYTHINQIRDFHSCCYEWLLVVFIVEINVFMFGIALIYLSALFYLFLIDITFP
jgi:hypothetical protein